MTKERISCFVESRTLAKIDALLRHNPDETRSRFIRRALRNELDRISGKKKRISWRDLDDAALDGLAELAKRARKKG